MFGSFSLDWLIILVQYETRFAPGAADQQVVIPIRKKLTAVKRDSIGIEPG